MEQICKVSSNKSNTNILLKIIRYMISLKIYFYVLIYLYFFSIQEKFRVITMCQTLLLGPEM